VVAYHAMMARLHLTFAKQQALLSSMAAPAAPHTEAQREPMVVSDGSATTPPNFALFHVHCDSADCAALVGLTLAPCIRQPLSNAAPHQLLAAVPNPNSMMPPVTLLRARMPAHRARISTCCKSPSTSKTLIARLIGVQMYRVNAVAAQVQEILREYAHTSFAYLRPAQACPLLAVISSQVRA